MRQKIIFFMLMLTVSLSQAAGEPDNHEEMSAVDTDISHYTKLAEYNNDLMITVLLYPGLATHTVKVPKEQGIASLAFWMRAGLPPSSYAEVNPFAVESRAQLALKAHILEADGELTPANVMQAALNITEGQYPEAIRIAANVFKEAEGRARLAALAGTFPDEAQHEDFLSKLVDLRPSPSHGEDKLTPWVDYFSALFAGSVAGESQLSAWLNTFPAGANKDARMSVWQSSALDTLRVLQPALRNATRQKPAAGLVSDEMEKPGFLEQLFSAFGGWLKRGESAKTLPSELPTECKGKGRLDVDVFESCQQGRQLWLNPVVSIAGESRCGKQLRKVVFDPMHETEVPAGRYHIKVDADTFGVVEDDLDIQAGRTLKKSVQLCGQPSIPAPEHKSKPPTSRITKSKAGYVVLAANRVELRPGESAPIPAWIVDENGWNTGASLAEIHSDNTMVAQTGTDATIKALEPGETRLKISLKGQKPQEIKVTVLGHSLVSCRIAPMVNLIRVGDAVQFLGQGILSNGTITTEMAMKWRSADDTIAIFLDNHSGRVQTRQPGNVEIQAEASLPNSKVACSTTLKVEPVVLRQSMRAARVTDPGASLATEKPHRQQSLGQMAGGWQCLSNSPRGKSRERFITLAPSGTSYMLVLPGGIKTHGKMAEDNRYEFTFRSSSATVNLALKAGTDGLVGEERLQLDDGTEQNASIKCSRAEM